MAHMETWEARPNMSVTTTRVQPLSEYPAVFVPYTIILVVLIMLGTFGNSLIITTILGIKTLRTTANMFLCNLAIADLSVSSIVNTFNLLAVFKGEEWFTSRPHACQVLSAICLIACAASLYNMAGVAINRYIHICHNHLYDRIFTRYNTLAMCGVIWLLVFINGQLPTFVGFGSHGFDRKSLMCVWDRLANYNFSLYILLFGIVTMVFCMFVFYAKLYLYVMAKKKEMVDIMKAESVTAGEMAAERARRDSVRLARTLFIIFVTCVVMWTPYTLEILIDRYDRFPFQIHLYCSLLTHANSCVNVIIYGVTNKDFRKGYIKILQLEQCCAKHIQRDCRTVNTTSVYSIQNQGRLQLQQNATVSRIGTGVNTKVR